jgi:hypothetical protein
MTSFICSLGRRTKRPPHLRRILLLPSRAFTGGADNLLVAAAGVAGFAADLAGTVTDRAADCLCSVTCCACSHSVFLSFNPRKKHLASSML